MKDVCTFPISGYQNLQPASERQNVSRAYRRDVTYQEFKELEHTVQGQENLDYAAEVSQDICLCSDGGI